jgi:catechol 2,3-dioxygenase-like lactoylglutathione lyase family enzyme
MSIQLNHTFVLSRDPQASSEFVAEILGCAPPKLTGPFPEVRLDNDVLLEFFAYRGPAVRQHFAFLVSEEEFDGIFERVTRRGLSYYGGPVHSQPGHINTRDGGRGFYFDDPDGNALEVITRPYGGSM